MSTLLLLVLVCTLTLHVSTAWAEAPRMLSDAVLDRDFPDPGILTHGTTFYVYATNSGGCNVQVASSKDLAQWEVRPDALPVLPRWARSGYTWAPEACQLPGREDFRLYFVARDRQSRRQAIGIATSDRPDGPFRCSGATLLRPLIEQEDAGGSIDPCFYAENNTPYLLWKNDGNAVGLKTWLFIQKLAPDGLSLLGRPTPLLCADLPWEGNLIEAPTLLRRGSKYYLFYSANAYDCERYAIGYAVADSLFGPYTKSPTPLLKSDASTCGPGGQTIVECGGKTWLLYHAWDRTERYRALHVARIDWRDEKPVVVPAQFSELPNPEREELKN